MEKEALSQRPKKIHQSLNQRPKSKGSNMEKEALSCKQYQECL